MSIPFSGRWSRSGGLVSALAKQIKLLNFRAAKRITVTFDPFDNPEIVRPTRDYLFHISSPKISATNPNCVVKTEIVCNRQKPTVTFQLIPTLQESEKLKTIKIESENLSLLELLSLTNEHITKRAPKEEPVSSLKTKSEKKGAAGKRR